MLPWKRHDDESVWWSAESSPRRCVTCGSSAGICALNESLPERCWELFYSNLSEEKWIWTPPWRGARVRFVFPPLQSNPNLPKAFCFNVKSLKYRRCRCRPVRRASFFGKWDCIVNYVSRKACLVSQSVLPLKYKKRPTYRDCTQSARTLKVPLQVVTGL